jgi:regulator of sigma E protease
MPDFLVFVIVISSLILGHELGHFLVARWLGIEVQEFGFGFPPRLFTLFTAKGTLFTVNLIPLGGFVRIAGEDDPGVLKGLAAAKKRVRTAVLLAGPIANVFLAFVAFTASAKFASPDLEKVIITFVEPGTPAETAGILPGDLIMKVDDNDIDSLPSLQNAITSRKGDDVSITLLRDGEKIVANLVPRVEFPEGQGPIGVTLGFPTRETSWLESISSGFEATRIQFSEILHLPGRLIRGDLEPEEARVSGLKGMYDMLAWAGEIDRTSQRPFLTLNLIGIISAGLAIANLLPFPALDGGRLMFVAFEILFGRRIEPRYEGLAHTIGFVVLLAILFYVNFLDFVNPIELP